MPELQFGITLPYGDPRRAAGYAQMAEDAGWDAVFVGDAIWTVDPLIQLAGCAMLTSRIRLGTLVLAAPLRRPWHLASESLALDKLSNGRLILGLATGAAWMGWQAFPDVPLETRVRAEMLDETIDILTQMHQNKQFDYAGEHYHIQLSTLDPMHYPGPTVQQPRIPIWVPGAWPRMKSMRRALKCDGLLPAKMNAEGKFEDVQPADVAAMREYICQNRPGDLPPLDIIVEGKTAGFSPAQAQETLRPWVEAGTTWWIESMWGADDAQMEARIQQGPPRGG